MLDWGLAVEALNKVDAGVPEKVRLWQWDGIPRVAAGCFGRDCCAWRRELVVGFVGLAT